MSETIYTPPQDIRSVAVIGTGSVGCGWAALFLARGMRVFAYDSSPQAESRVREFVSNAWAGLFSLGIAGVRSAPLDLLQFVSTPTEAVQLADLVQENVPEQPDLKRTVLTELDAAATPNKVILSSTGGMSPTALQASCVHPERLVVVHPFHPSHLIPLVEVIGGKHTTPEVIDWALEFSRLIGKRPIRLNAEASGHLTNRLQFALVREAVACLLEGIASAGDIDAAVRYGLGPRWSLMGSLLTLHLAGGAGGMRGILDHAGGSIQEWWTPMAVPQLTPEVKARLVAASEELSEGLGVDQWAAWRDTNLVDVLKLQMAREHPDREPDQGVTYE
ncbi:L-carnitine dehydrogenase (plasmid) [Caballeronia sp. S22]